MRKWKLLRICAKPAVVPTTAGRNSCKERDGVLKMQSWANESQELAAVGAGIGGQAYDGDNFGERNTRKKQEARQVRGGGPPCTSSWLLVSGRLFCLLDRVARVMDGIRRPSNATRPRLTLSHAVINYPGIERRRMHSRRMYAGTV